MVHFIIMVKEFFLYIMVYMCIFIKFFHNKTAPENRFGLLKAVKPLISIAGEVRDSGGNKPQ
jgi:hypothetical protein